MAGFKVRLSGLWRDPGAIRVRRSGVFVSPSSIRARVAGAWREVWTAMSALVQGFMYTQTVGGGSSQSVLDTGTFNVSTSPAAAITAYDWHVQDNGGQLVQVSAPTSASFTVRGPIYNSNGFTFEQPFLLSCTVTIGGRQYTTPEVEHTYKVSGPA